MMDHRTEPTEATEESTRGGRVKEGPGGRRGRSALEAFARSNFGDVCRLRPSGLHVYLFKRRTEKTRRAVEKRRGCMDVVLAPRGSAKTTLVSLIFPIHALLNRIEPYIVLIGATMRQASRRLANIRSMLRHNAALREHYPEAFEEAPAASARSIEWLGGRIDAFSAGTELRGISHGAWRPSWIILDDAERSERVRSARHRDALAEWFSEVVENLGAPYTHIDVIGTLLHADALPARLARRPDVIARTFASIIREADNEALWEKWRALFHNLDDPERLKTARDFFKANRDAMREGARVLWQAREDYYALQVMRETRGRAAFDKEKQNVPLHDGAGVFTAARLRRFDLVDARIVREPWGGDAGAIEGDAAAPPERALADLRLFGFLDPALGAASGDYAAIATVGLDPAGYAYLLDVWLDRVPPTAQIERAFALHAQWGYEWFGIETNAFQKLLLEPVEAERRRRRARGVRWDLPVAARTQRGDKAGRILALEPLVANGWLLFNRELPAEFLRQLEDFPGGDHDDGPDALAAAVALARGGAPRLAQLKSRPRPTSPSIRQY